MRYYVGKQCGQSFIKTLFNAQKNMHICSPYIDEHYATAIVREAQKGKTVNLITSNKSTGGEFSFYRFIQPYVHSCPNLHCIVTRGEELVHAKMFLKDNDFGVDGSCNLTTNGLYHQVNYIHIYQSEQEVLQLAEVFHKMWDFNADGLIR